MPLTTLTARAMAALIAADATDTYGRPYIGRKVSLDQWQVDLAPKTLALIRENQRPGETISGTLVRLLEPIGRHHKHLGVLH